MVRAPASGEDQLAPVRLDGAPIDGRRGGGGYAAGAIPDEALLAVIGVTLLYFGIDLLRSRHGSSPTPGGSRIEADAPPRRPRGSAHRGRGSGLLGGLVGLLVVAGLATLAQAVA